MLFIAAVVAAAISSAQVQPAPPDGTYKYSIIQSGNQVGSSTLTLKRSGSDIVLHENETMGDLTFVIDETVDASTLAPKTYVATYTKGDGSQTARASFDRTGATVSFDGVSGNQAFPLTGSLKNVYVLESAIMTGFFLLPAQIHASKVNQFMQLIPSGVQSLTSHVNNETAGPRPSDVPATDVSLSIVSRVNFDEWYDPNTFVLHNISVPIQDVQIKLTK